MLISDMMEPGGRVFLKSEFSPIGDQWPCVSFSKMNVGRKLQAEFRPGRDILIYVGTTDATRTEDPNHRSRLLSAVSIEPRKILESRSIVPTEIWAEAVTTYGENTWRHALHVLDAATMAGPPFPDARALVPRGYSQLGAMENRGGVAEVFDDERTAVMSLPVTRIELRLSPEAIRYMQLMGALSKNVAMDVKQEAARMALLIQDRVARGGELGLKSNPIRSAPNVSDLVALIIRKWTIDQYGKCALCHGPLVKTEHKLLQPSADRIDSTNGAYDDSNIQITHLACNWAKNQYGADAFFEWLRVIQDARLLEVEFDA